MNSMFLQFAAWLAGQSFSIGLHESFYMYSWIEAAHVMTLMISLGMLAIIDLRLLGVCLTNVPASKIARRLDKPMRIDFSVMLITGALLFTAIQLRATESLWFRTKVFLLLAACINAWLIRRKMVVAAQSWDLAPSLRCACESREDCRLPLWAGVIVTGRFIAYEWIDCCNDNPAFVDWAAGGVTAPSGQLHGRASCCSRFSNG